jgi:hypothetical protein
MAGYRRLKGLLRKTSAYYPLGERQAAVLRKNLGNGEKWVGVRLVEKKRCAWGGASLLPDRSRCVIVAPAVGTGQQMTAAVQCSAIIRRQTSWTTRCLSTQIDAPLGVLPLQISASALHRGTNEEDYLTSITGAIFRPRPSPRFVLWNCIVQIDVSCRQTLLRRARQRFLPR